MQLKWIVDLPCEVSPNGRVTAVEILEAGRPNISEGLDQPNDHRLLQGGHVRVILFNRTLMKCLLNMHVSLIHCVRGDLILPSVLTQTLLIRELSKTHNPA